MVKRECNNIINHKNNMFQKTKNQWSSLFIIIIVCVFSAFSFIYADWQEPAGSPPGNNVAAPVNVGNILQVRQGALRVVGAAQVGGLSVDTLVGIGTTSPDTILDLDSSSIAGDKMEIRMRNTDPGDTADQFSSIISNRLSNGNSSLSFGTTRIGTYGTKVTIDSIGNVGIGTTTPSAKLDVAGAIHLSPATGPNVSADGIIYYDSTLNKFRCYQGSWVDCIGSGSGGGLPSGTNNQTLRNENGNWVANSFFTVGTSGVGIGTSGPVSGVRFAVDTPPLDPSSGIRVNTNSIIISAEDPNFYILNVSSNNTSRFFVSRSGRVGVGTASIHQNQNILFDVNGSMLSRKNTYVQSPINSNIVVGVGELQTAINDWPGRIVYGVGWDSISGLAGIAAPHKTKFLLWGYGGGQATEQGISLVGSRNVYVQSPINPGIVVGVGELQTAMSDWPGKTIYGLGWDWTSGAVGALIPSGTTFGIYGAGGDGKANFAVTGNIVVGGSAAGYRTGITLYDTVDGSAHCVRISNNTLNLANGVCP